MIVRAAQRFSTNRATACGRNIRASSISRRISPDAHAIDHPDRFSAFP
jgi:hypothetical protein